MNKSSMLERGWRFTHRTCVAVAAAMVIFAGLGAARGAAGPAEASFQADARGFGPVKVGLRYFGANQENSWTNFAAADAEHAKVCGSKRLADLLGFGDLKVVADSGLPGTVLELHGAG
ncbi:MAG: hypothetical protein WCI73_17055, partial [Phycisphaerae bacterium]